MNGKSLALREVALPEIVINLGIEQAELVKPAKAALELANDMTIDSLGMAQQAQQEVATWTKSQMEIEAWRKKITVPIDDAKAYVMDFVRPAMDGYKNAETLLKGKVARWQSDERSRVARETAAREEVARKERERLEAEARERDRQAREKQAEADRKAREAQETQDAEKRAQLQAESDAAARQADQHRHEAATGAAIAQVIVAAPVEEPGKVAGMRFTDRVEIAVEDLEALVKWCAANPAFVHLLTPNLSEIKALQKAMKDRFAVPGVKVTKELAAGRASKAA